MQFEQANGIQVFEGRPPNIDARLTVVRVMADGRVTIGAGDKPGEGFTLSEYVSRSRARVVASGGYMKSFDPPLPAGLVKKNGIVLNRLESSSLLDGLFCVDTNGRTSIMRLSANRDAGCHEALQSGPVLIIDGKAASATTSDAQRHLIVTSRYSRAFACTHGDGRVSLGRTGPITLTGLSEFLARAEATSGLGCSAAITLPHGGGGGLIVPAFRLSRGNPASLFPNAILIR